MKFVKGLLVVALATTLLQGAEKKVSPVMKAWKAQVKEAKASVTTITPKELMSWNKSNKKFVLLDVREPAEVEAGRIEAETFKKIPRGLVDVLVAKAGALKPDQVVVVYCKKGARGALAGKTLKSLGFKNVYNLKGGILGWIKAEMPIVNSLGTFKSVPYKLTGVSED